MTGSNTYASPLMTERPLAVLPRDVAGLSAECKRRRIDFTGSKQELASRLSADELTHSRAFTTVFNAPRRGSESDTTMAAPKPVRHFNSSPVLKAVNDTSTLDLAYLPRFESETQEIIVRVPMIGPTTTTTHDAPEPEVMRAQIVSLSADSNHSAISDLHDNNAMPIDFHAVTDRVAAVASRIKEETSANIVDDGGALKQLWNGLIEDIVGPKKKIAV